MRRHSTYHLSLKVQGTCSKEQSSQICTSLLYILTLVMEICAAYFKICLSIKKNPLAPQYIHWEKDFCTDNKKRTTKCIFKTDACLDSWMRTVELDSLEL